MKLINQYSLPSLLAAASLALPSLAGAQELLSQPGVVTGTMEIAFNTRLNLDDKGKPKVGFKDTYKIDLNVAKTTQFTGKIERQPTVTGGITGKVQQQGQYIYGLDLFVLNPADLTQKKQVGKWIGTVPVDTNGVFILGGLGDSPHRIAVDAVGKASAFTDPFGGKLHGKGKKTGGALSYVRQWQGKEVKIEVKNADPMKFESVVLAMGPAQIYPSTTVNGSLDFDYETSNWLTTGLKFSYTSNGKPVEDVVTGSIKWTDDPARDTNGKGHYDFNLRFNESAAKPAATENEAFAKLSEEDAFFVVDKTTPSLSGTVEYVDTMTKVGGEDVPKSSVITYNLEANQLTKQQVMNFVKLWLLAVGPANDE